MKNKSINNSVAIITARGGSKRIPGKNIKRFAGKPMLAWPIEAAKSSGLFDRIVLSTDSDTIAAVGKEYGAEAPFKRPPELADDHTPTAPVIIHALEWLTAHGCTYKYACCIYPTAPFLLDKDLQRGLTIVEESNAPGALSVTTFPYPILRAFSQHADGSLAFAWPEYELTRSQDLPEFYHDAGQFYWLDTAQFMEQKRLIMPGMMPVPLPRIQVQDIDSPEDWDTAETLMMALNSRYMNQTTNKQ